MRDALYFSGSIRFSKSDIHGYGVFSTRQIQKDEVLEECPYVSLSSAWVDVDESLKDYLFALTNMPSSTSATLTEEIPNAIVGGHAMFYNHSEQPNVYYKISKTKRVFSFISLTDIEKGEELFISYGDDSYSGERVRSKNG